MDYELLCARFLQNQDMGPLLRSVCNSIERYRLGYPRPGQGSRRRSDLEAAVKQARALRRSLEKLDPRTLVEAMGPLRGREIHPYATDDHATVLDPHQKVYESYVPLRVAQLHQFIALLKGVSDALEVAGTAIPVRRQRPPVDDPLVFGIEALQGLWMTAFCRRPTLSYKKNGFGDFAIMVFGPDGLRFKEAEIRTAVRKVLSAPVHGSDTQLPGA